jgi:hypothetical protein
MSIQELIPVIPPPEQPVESGDRSMWKEIEENLGTLLPRDYKDFVHTYGTGKLADFIHVFNPFAKDEYVSLLPCVKRLSSILRQLKDFETDLFPYHIYPDSPGLLPWASDENGNWYFWLTRGKPDDWPTVLRGGRSPNWEEFTFSMTSFLARSLSQSIPCPLWPNDFPDPSNPKDHSFVPLRKKNG